MTTARRIIDPTMVPRGPHGEFPRQLCDQLDELTNAVNNVREDAQEAAEEASRFKRVKACVNDPSDPFTINAKEHPPGTLFDDVGASAATGIKLPTRAQLLQAGYDLDEEVVDYYFLNTSGQTMTIEVGDTSTETIEVGPTGGSVTSFTLPRDNETIRLALIDDRWRALWVNRRTGCGVTRTQFTLATGTPTLISWSAASTVFTDPDGFFDSGTPTRLTIPSGRGGLYMCEVMADFDQNATGIRYVNLLHKNSGGTTLANRIVQGNSSATHNCVVQVTHLFPFAVGDYVEVYVLQNSGGDLLVGKDGHTRLNLGRLIG